MNAHLSADFSQYLAQQCKRSHYHLSGLLVSMLALLLIRKVCFFYIVVLRSQSMLAKLTTDSAHHLVRPLDTFPKQLPIPVASLTEQQLIAALMEQIRTSKKMAPNNSIENIEREIDKIVYQLYGLTDAEIKIIEQSI